MPTRTAVGDDTQAAPEVLRPSRRDEASREGFAVDYDRIPSLFGVPSVSAQGFSSHWGSWRAQEALGFPLRSFGPLAAALVMVLFRLMVSRFLHYAGMGITRAAALVYVTVLLMMLAVAPGLFD